VGGGVEATDKGTPQGGVLSPLLANIYLHQLDAEWKRRGLAHPCGANAKLIRYADDCAPRSCTRDEGRPLGTGLQEQVPNHLELHGSRACVVSVEEKAWQRPCQMRYRETRNTNHRRGVESVWTMSKLGAVVTPGQAQGKPVYCLGGIRHKGGVTLYQALVWNVGTCRPDAKGETQVVAP
jgi:hypothetical protein